MPSYRSSEPTARPDYVEAGEYTVEVANAEETVSQKGSDMIELKLRVQPSGAIFDLARLDWLNGQWIRRLPPDELTERALPFLADSLAAEAAAGTVTRSPTADDLELLLPMVTERLPRRSQLRWSR